MSFSENVKKYRQARGLTQEQLANLLGISAQAVSKWETSETYPDGALLVPLAEALEVSLDSLFGREFGSMDDLTARLYRRLEQTKREDQMREARAIGWQLEKALFNTYMKIGATFDPAELTDNRHSYILSDYGFTVATNNTAAPFFAVFEEPENGFGDAIDEKLLCRIFSALSSPETMRALVYIHGKEPGYVMEAAVIGRDCEIEADKLDKVMDDLCYLGVLSRRKLNMAGGELTLYATRTWHFVMAVLLLAREIRWKGGFTKQAHYREKPFVR